MAKDLRLTATGDLDVSQSSLHLIEGNAYVVQRLKQRLQTLLSEWYLDRRVGIPYLQDIFVKAPDISSIVNVFSLEILDTPGLARLESIDGDYDRGARTLEIPFRAIFERETPDQVEEDLTGVASLNMDDGSSLLIFESDFIYA